MFSSTPSYSLDYGYGQDPYAAAAAVAAAAPYAQQQSMRMYPSTATAAGRARDTHVAAHRAYSSGYDPGAVGGSMYGTAADSYYYNSTPAMPLMSDPGARSRQVLQDMGQQSEY